MLFVERQGTASSIQGVRDVIEQRGLFCALYTDRGSPYWTTPETDGILFVGCSVGGYDVPR